MSVTTYSRVAAIAVGAGRVTSTAHTAARTAVTAADAASSMLVSRTTASDAEHGRQRQPDAHEPATAMCQPHREHDHEQRSRGPLDPGRAVDGDHRRPGSDRADDPRDERERR